jgi:ribosomal-protein-alanine N-acetyltransferase
MPRSTEQIRPLTGSDQALVTYLLQTSEYVYQRFTPEELPMILSHYPALGVFSGSTLRCCLLTQTVNPPTAWLGGFCVTWTESKAYLRYLTTLLDAITPLLIAKGARSLYYSGNDVENDWLRTVLLTMNFQPYRFLYAYDKYDYDVPTWGNRQVIVRHVEESDIPALLNIEAACFEHLLRYDAISFRDIAATHPYFVVAELGSNVIGYQFNAVDQEYGYLVRIAVHPSVSGQGIGARLMAEAIAFFERANVLRIMLNTQDDNAHAHRLYEWFGFVRIPQTGFVLRKAI